MSGVVYVHCMEGVGVVCVIQVKTFIRCRLSSFNAINGVMVSMLSLSVVDCGFESRSGQTKDYISSLSMQH